MVEMKQIKGYPDYSVTRDGRIWSKPRQRTKGGWLKLQLDKTGYQYILLRKKRKVKKYLVHRIVGQAFVLNLKNKPCINHLNGIKTDNRAENLEWVTHQENADHAVLNNLTNPAEKNGSSKLTWKQVKEIRAKHISKGIVKRKPWDKYGISNPQYYNILNYKSWKGVPS